MYLDDSSCLAITTKGGQWFILHGTENQGVVYFWMTVLADKDEAKKHMCQLTVEQIDESENKKVR